MVLVNEKRPSEQNYDDNVCFPPIADVSPSVTVT